MALGMAPAALSRCTDACVAGGALKAVSDAVKATRAADATDLPVGTRVRHHNAAANGCLSAKGRGLGTVEACDDGLTTVRFDSGEVHRYKPSSKELVRVVEHNAAVHAAAIDEAAAAPRHRKTDGEGDLMGDLEGWHADDVYSVERPRRERSRGPGAKSCRPHRGSVIQKSSASSLPARNPVCSSPQALRPGTAGVDTLSGMLNCRGDPQGSARPDARPCATACLNAEWAI